MRLGNHTSSIIFIFYFIYVFSLKVSLPETRPKNQVISMAGGQAATPSPPTRMPIQLRWFIAPFQTTS